MLISALGKYPLTVFFLVIAILIFAVSCTNPIKQRENAHDAFNRGVRAIKADNMDMASHYFKRALIHSPDFYEARLNLANVYFLDGRLDDARDEYSKLLQDNVNDPRIHFNLGWIYLAQSNYDTAYKCFYRNLQDNVPFNDGHFGLALVARGQGEDILAQFHLEKYLESEPDGRWSDRASTLLSQLTGTEVQTVVDPISDDPSISEHPTEFAPPPEEIIKIVEPEIEPDKPFAVEPKEEKPVIEQPRSKDPTPSVVKKPEPKKEKSTQELIQEGFKALNENDLTTAERILKEVYSRDSSSSDISYGLARIYFKTNKRDEMMKFTKRMIDSTGGDSNNAYELGMALEKVGDWKSAISYYSQYLRENPFGVHSDKAKERLTRLDRDFD